MITHVHSSFIVHNNKHYSQILWGVMIHEDNIHILYWSCNVKKPNITAKLSKKSKTKRRSSHLYDVLYHVRAYAVMQL
jgi:hypothetical protein